MQLCYLNDDAKHTRYQLRHIPLWSESELRFRLINERRTHSVDLLHIAEQDQHSRAPSCICPLWQPRCRLTFHVLPWVGRGLLREPLIRMLVPRRSCLLLSRIALFRRWLIASELRILRDIVQSSTDANDGASFLAIFKAYDSVLKTHNIDPSTDRIYFKSLLRLARLNGATWVEKFDSLLRVRLPTIASLTLLTLRKWEVQGAV